MAEMPDRKVTALASIVAKSGKETMVKAALQGLLSPARQEPGCVRFDLFTSAEDPREFLIVESWSSREAMELHLSAPYVSELVVHAAEFLDQPPDIILFREHEHQE